MAPTRKTYIIQEIATYYVLAKTKRAAERLFLNAIAFNTPAPFGCEVTERDVYPDPENRLVKKEGA